MKRIIIICLLALVLAMPLGAAGEAAYPDVGEGDWFYDAVVALTEGGVLHGFEDGCFHPEKPLTRAQLVKMLCADAVTEPVYGSAWWLPYYEAGLAAGIMTEDDRSRMDEPVNRYQTALLLAKTGLLPTDETLAVTVDWTQVLNTIADMEDIPYDCLEAVVTVYAAGVMNGYDDGCFHGARNLSRAEGAQIVRRLREESLRTPRYDCVATDQWFADTLILGNSLAGGLAKSQTLTTPDYLYCNGGSVFTLEELSYVDQRGLHWRFGKRIAIGIYSKIIIIFGTNEMGVDETYTYTHFLAMLEQVKSAQPEADIWLCNAPPINERLGGSEQFSAAHCLAVNDIIDRVAEEQALPVIDVWSHFADESGALPADATWDGIHLKQDGYADWAEFLKYAVVNP